MHTCMCNWVTMLYSRKLTEHCKPAIMEKIKIIIYIKKNQGWKGAFQAKLQGHQCGLFFKRIISTLFFPCWYSTKLR